MITCILSFLAGFLLCYYLLVPEREPEREDTTKWDAYILEYIAAPNPARKLMMEDLRQKCQYHEFERAYFKRGGHLKAKMQDKKEDRGNDGKRVD